MRRQSQRNRPACRHYGGGAGLNYVYRPCFNNPSPKARRPSSIVSKTLFGIIPKIRRKKFGFLVTNFVLLLLLLFDPFFAQLQGESDPELFEFGKRMDTFIDIDRVVMHFLSTSFLHQFHSSCKNFFLLEDQTNDNK